MLGDRSAPTESKRGVFHLLANASDLELFAIAAYWPCLKPQSHLKR